MYKIVEWEANSVDTADTEFGIRRLTWVYTVCTGMYVRRRSLK